MFITDNEEDKRKKNRKKLLEALDHLFETIEEEEEE